jgi:hypothetical protein
VGVAPFKKWPGDGSSIPGRDTEGGSSDARRDYPDCSEIRPRDPCRSLDGLMFATELWQVNMAAGIAAEELAAASS